MKIDTECCCDPAERDCKNLNDLPGGLQGYDCELCKNKGTVYVVKDGYVVAQECNCMLMRRNIVRIHESGLEELLRRNTLDTYITQENWQKGIKAVALDFLKSDGKDWFFIGGQVGAGKTHICTAIVGELMQRGYSAKYMQWRQEATKLKSVINDKEYEPLMDMLKTVSVLYIDDLFKGGTDKYGKKELPTPGDINLAFDIIATRYNQNLVTLISSERTMTELLAVDEAIGSRIAQKANKYKISLTQDEQKNYRLRGTEH